MPHFGTTISFELQYVILHITWNRATLVQRISNEYYFSKIHKGVIKVSYYYYYCTSSWVWHHHFCVFRSGNTKTFLSLYFSRLNNPTSLSFSHIECSGHPHCCLQASLCTFPALGSQNSGQSTLETISQILNRSGGSLSSTCWLHFCQGNPGCCCPSLLQGHIAGACSPCCPAWSPGYFCSGLLPSCSYPSLYWCVGQSSPRCKVCICILDLCEVPARPVLQPEQLLQNPSPALQCIGCSPSVSVSPANLWRVALHAVLSHSCNNHIPCQGSFQVQELKELAWIWWKLHKENEGDKPFSPSVMSKTYRRAVASSQSPVPQLPLLSIFYRLNRKSCVTEVPWEGSSLATFKQVSKQARCWFLWDFCYSAYYLSTSPCDNIRSTEAAVQLFFSEVG